MSVTRELARLAWSVLRLAVVGRRPMVLWGVVLLAAAALTFTAFSVVGPYVLYPFV